MVVRPSFALLQPALARAEGWLQAALPVGWSSATLWRRRTTCGWSGKSRHLRVSTSPAALTTTASYQGSPGPSAASTRLPTPISAQVAGAGGPPLLPVPPPFPPFGFARPPGSPSGGLAEAVQPASGSPAPSPPAGRP